MHCVHVVGHFVFVERLQAVLLRIDSFGNPRGRVSLAHRPACVRMYHDVVVDVRSSFTNGSHVHVLLVELLLQTLDVASMLYIHETDWSDVLRASLLIGSISPRSQQ